MDNHFVLKVSPIKAVGKDDVIGYAPFVKNIGGHEDGLKRHGPWPCNSCHNHDEWAEKGGWTKPPYATQDEAFEAGVKAIEERQLTVEVPV